MTLNLSPEAAHLLQLLLSDQHDFLTTTYPERDVEIRVLKSLLAQWDEPEVAPEVAPEITEDAEAMFEAAFNALAKRHPEFMSGDVPPWVQIPLLWKLTEAAQPLGSLELP